MTQNLRDRVMNKFRKSGLEFLVATDIAARGIDVDDVQVVFNYDLPYDGEDYVHRIGRTGRAGASGIAVSFANHAERATLRNIERFTGAAIPTHTIPGLEPRARSSSAVDARRSGLAKPAPRGRSYGTPSAYARDGKPGGYRGRDGASGGYSRKSDRSR